MINTPNIEEIKNEITRWAVTKTPLLYEHFSKYLGIEKKEVRKLFTDSDEIQDHINQYFQEERVQERAELAEQLEKDLATLEELVTTAAENNKILLVGALAKSTGIARCNIKKFAKANPELWGKVVGPTAIAERRRLEAERKAAIEAEQAEQKRLKAERKADREAEKAAVALIKKLSEVKPNRGELTIAQLKAKKREKPPTPNWLSQPYLSCAVCDYAYEKGRLVKKVRFKIALAELSKIGYEHHLSLFFDGDNKVGIYVQEHHHLGTFAGATGPLFHTFDFTWHKRMCREPKPSKMVPLHFTLVETGERKGLCFKLPEEFFLDFIYD